MFILHVIHDFRDMKIIGMLSKRVWTYIVVTFTTTCAMAGTTLVALCLVLDIWRSSDNKMVEYLQGITHECARTDDGPMDCYSWQHSISTHKIFRKLFCYIVIDIKLVSRPLIQFC